MFRRLAQFLFGLDQSFLDGKGELGVRFDPHWPGPMLGDPGQWQNYLLAVTAIALLLILARKTATKQLHRVRIVLAMGSAAVVALLVPAALGIHWWNLLLVVAMFAALLFLYLRKREVALMGLGRAALYALLLMVVSGTVAWNLTLGIAGGLLVLYVYRREGRSAGTRIFLGILRAGLIALVLLLLNNPILSRLRTITEPSVVAVLIDDSLSMSVRDVNPSGASAGDTRLAAAVKLFTNEDQSLIRKLAKVHTLQFYSFDQSANPVGQVVGPDESTKKGEPAKQDSIGGSPTRLAASLDELKPEGASTQVVPSILKVLAALQGQRLAGVVIVTDGRDTPTSPLAEAYKQLANFGIKVYPIAVGSDKAPKNITLQTVNVQDSAFKDDIVNLRATVRAAGYEPGHAITLRLTNAATGLPLKAPDGSPVERVIHPADSNPLQEELLFKPDQVGTLKIKIETVYQPGELDADDNTLQADVSVLDAKINVLYVEGYPRWEYRYIKNEMIRDKTVNISCLLTSADPTFIQEHTDMKQRGEDAKFKYFPYSQFPASMEQLMETDVVLLGDVDPRQFADSQLQLLYDFVDKKGGGFGMIAGPNWSPGAYKNTPIESILPVAAINSDSGWPTEPITEGFRPSLTKDGSASALFRFFNDRVLNDEYLKNQWQPLFWYRRGLVAKAGADVYAEHPTDLDPTGNHKAPLLILGRFGAGRTLFSAYDDSWRWRFYTGESIFDTYWIQQLRYLARGKKLGQRTITYGPDRKKYQLGEEVHLNLRVMNPAVLRELSPKIEVQVRDEKTGQVVQSVIMQNSTAQPDYYTAAFSADRVGHFKLEVHDDAVNRAATLDESMEVIIPRLELAEPQVDTTLLSHVATETGGVALTLDQARTRLPELIQSAARTIAPPDDHPLWDKPFAMVIFMLLLTSEWVLRKAFGMV